MKDTAMTSAAVLFVCSMLAFGIWWKVSVWSECRADHSFMYCMTMMGGK